MSPVPAYIFALSFRFGKMVLERLYFWSGVFLLSFFTKINDTLFLMRDEEEA